MFSHAAPSAQQDLSTLRTPIKSWECLDLGRLVAGSWLDDSFPPLVTSLDTE